MDVRVCMHLMCTYVSDIVASLELGCMVECIPVLQRCNYCKVHEFYLCELYE